MLDVLNVIGDIEKLHKCPGDRDHQDKHQDGVIPIHVIFYWTNQFCSNYTAKVTKGHIQGKLAGDTFFQQHSIEIAKMPMQAKIKGSDNRS